MVSFRFAVYVPRSITKTQNMKVKVLRSKYENFLCSFQKIQNNVNRIHLQCCGFTEIPDMIITGPTELNKLTEFDQIKELIECHKM